MAGVKGMVMVRGKVRVRVGVMVRGKGMGRVGVGVMVMEEILCRERVKVRNLKMHKRDCKRTSVIGRYDTLNSYLGNFRGYSGLTDGFLVRYASASGSVSDIFSRTKRFSISRKGR